MKRAVNRGCPNLRNNCISSNLVLVTSNLVLNTYCLWVKTCDRCTGFLGSGEVTSVGGRTSVASVVLARHNPTDTQSPQTKSYTLAGEDEASY